VDCTEEWLIEFGIVISFKVKAFASRNIWGGSVYYASRPLPQVLKSACDLLSTDTNKNDHIMCSAGYDYWSEIIVCPVYDMKEEENAKSFRRFSSIQP
jgi:hypothetical protein